MKVSVVIPVYNVELYIRDCLESIVNQTIGNDIEIIIVNDGSFDKSQAIIDEYALKDSRIKKIVQENKGLSGARNTGIDCATGKYIYFMDSDDYLELTALEKLYNLAEKDNLDMICFEAESFLDAAYSGKLKAKDFNYKKNFSYNGIYNGIQLYSQLIKNEDFYASACLKFVRRSVLENNNIRFKEGIIHEDEWFSFITFIKSNQVRIINDILFHRRIRSDSIMTKRDFVKSFMGYSYTAMECFKVYEKLGNVEKSMVCEGCNNIFIAALETYMFIEKKDTVVKKQYTNLRKIVFERNHFAIRKTKIKYFMPFVFKIRLKLLGKMP